MREKILKELMDSQKNKDIHFNELLNNIRKYNKVVLYGVSEGCVEALKFFHDNNIEVDEIYDGDENKQGKLFYGIKVVKPDLTCQDKNIAIVVTISFYDEIKENFIKYDEKIEDRLFMYDGYFMKDLDFKDFLDNINKVVACYESLEDKFSKEMYLSLIKYRYIRDTNLIKNLATPRKYCYLDKVFLDRFNDGLYIDAGSYNADFVTSLEEIKDISKSKFYIFEPNKIMLERIKNNLNPKINAKFYQVALCDIESEMEFQQTETSNSHIVASKYNAYKNTLDSTLDIVKTNTLDNIIGEEKVAGIKVDIE